MSQLFSYCGDEDFYHGGSVCSNPMDFLPLGHHVDVYLPSKRTRINAPLVNFRSLFPKKPQTSIDVLPDECLFEILRRLPVGQDRSTCACVSKRWLNLVSNIKISESAMEAGDLAEDDAEEGLVTMSLEGSKATDVRLAALAVGASARGGLGKLIIKGSNPTRGVTALGLRAVACCCFNLRDLSLWNAWSIGDEGLTEVAKGCEKLEKLDLTRCSMVTDEGLTAIAKGCPNLTSVTIESCENVGNEGLIAIGKYCKNLRSVSIRDCPLVGDRGISGLLSGSSFVLSELKLYGLNISDVSLACVGHYGLAITNVVLSRLQNVSERGFWCMGKGHGLQKLTTLSIKSCRGVTDYGLLSIAFGCPNMKSFRLSKCAFLSDSGLLSFAKTGVSLEALKLEECHRITQLGLFTLLVSCADKLKNLCVTSCFGIKDVSTGFTLPKPSESSLISLAIRDCPWFGDVNLALLSNFCSELKHLDLSKLVGISDNGIAPFLERCDAGLVKVKLGGCVNLTDRAVSALIRHHGGTLEQLSLEGCMKITDNSLVAISNDCFQLGDLDISGCAISNFGVSTMSQSKQLITLLTLSLSGCTFLSDGCAPFLAMLGEGLLGLNLKHCNGISSTVVDYLIEKLGQCNILS